MSWFDNVLTTAQQAAQRVGLPVSNVLAQWALESDYGQSDLASKHNLAGIEYTGAPGSYNADGRHAGYVDQEAFLNDYVRVLNLPFYTHIREAAGKGPDAVAKAFTETRPGVPPYAEDPAYSDKLVRILRENDLGKYDTPQVPWYLRIPWGGTVPIPNDMRDGPWYNSKPNDVKMNDGSSKAAAANGFWWANQDTWKRVGSIAIVVLIAVVLLGAGTFAFVNGKEAAD